MIPLLLVLQLATITADKLEMGLGPYAYVVPAELDGDPATREWVSWDMGGDWANWFRAVGVNRDGSLCLGERFWVYPQDPGVTWYGYVGRAGDRDRLLLQSITRYLEVTITPCPIR